jgi:hypothetical protein
MTERLLREGKGADLFNLGAVLKVIKLEIHFEKLLEIFLRMLWR